MPLLAAYPDMVVGRENLLHFPPSVHGGAAVLVTTVDGTTVEIGVGRKNATHSTRWETERECVCVCVCACVNCTDSKSAGFDCAAAG